jgi:hypothetical protein
MRRGLRWGRRRLSRLFLRRNMLFVHR